MVKDSGYNSGRINRDDLRAMIFDSKWSRDREKTIIACEKALAKVLLEQGRSAIVDDTNFKADFWKELYSDTWFDYSSETIFLDTPLEECIRRDKERGEKGLPSVGANVIIKTALRNGLVQFPDKPIVLVDIDGTLASSNGRERFLKGDKKNWDAYYSEIHLDSPVIEVFQKVKDLEDSGHLIIIVSGRGAEYEWETRKWFKDCWVGNPLFPELDVPIFNPFLFLFRDRGDRRPDEVVKPEFLKLLPSTPVKILDDRPRVCKAWEALGLNVEWIRGRDLEDF
jgi:predicted kinase